MSPIGHGLALATLYVRCAKHNRDAPNKGDLEGVLGAQTTSIAPEGAGNPSHGRSLPLDIVPNDLGHKRPKKKDIRNAAGFLNKHSRLLEFTLHLT